MKANLNRLALVLLIGWLMSLELVQAQDKEPNCNEHPKLLKDSKGKPVRLGYKQLKERATNCETVRLPGLVDAKGQVLVQVLVGPSGAVECAQAISGHPLARKYAQDTARKWTFKPMIEKGEKVAVIGILVMHVSWDYDEAKKKQCGK
jgi:hypothetical protein